MNPQAAHNICQFSFKERAFKIDDHVDHLVFHIHIDGRQLMKDSDAANDQEDYWDNVKKRNKYLLEQMNKAMP